MAMVTGLFPVIVWLVKGKIVIMEPVYHISPYSWRFFSDRFCIKTLSVAGIGSMQSLCSVTEPGLGPKCLKAEAPHGMADIPHPW